MRFEFRHSHSSIFDQFEDQQKMAATALLRLGECYRKQGKTNEALVQYQRVLQEFADQSSLVGPSERGLAAMGRSRTPARGAGRDDTAQTVRDEEAGEIDRIREMVRNSPDLANARDRSGHGPLHHAVRKGQRMVADFLLAKGASVDLRDNQGNTPLHLAVFSGHKPLVELLLSHHADVNAGNSRGITPLHIAVERGFRVVTEVLLANGADVNSVCHDASLIMIDPGGKETFRVDFPSGGAPLHTAVRLGRTEFVELLLARKPDVNLADDSGRTAFQLAVESGSLKVAERLLQAGANVSAADQSGLTALHLAAVNNNPEAVKWLLAHGADLNAKEQHGFTPLHLAVCSAKKESAELLIGQGAEVNTRDQSGETPLLRALGCLRKDMVEFLLTHGADPNVKNKKGLSPLGRTTELARSQNAAQANPDELADLLRKHGAKD